MVLLMQWYFFFLMIEWLPQSLKSKETSWYQFSDFIQISICLCPPSVSATISIMRPLPCLSNLLCHLTIRPKERLKLQTAGCLVLSSWIKSRLQWALGRLKIGKKAIFWRDSPSTSLADWASWIRHGSTLVGWVVQCWVLINWLLLSWSLSTWKHLALYDWGWWKGHFPFFWKDNTWC